MQCSDIDELLAADRPSPGLVIVPSRDGTGTNAILRTPPTLFPSHFGSDSFRKHLAEAESARAQVTIRRNPRLELDVDDTSDLRVLLDQDLSATETGRWLRSSGVEGKFLLNSRAAAISPR
jgi:2-phospho-L-lactate guanylyltransferase